MGGGALNIVRVLLRKGFSYFNGGCKSVVTWGGGL